MAAGDKPMLMLSAQGTAARLRAKIKGRAHNLNFLASNSRAAANRQIARGRTIRAILAEHCYAQLSISSDGAS